MGHYQDLQKSAEFLKQELKEIPKLALVLGSGLGDFADNATDATVIPYEKIPGFQKTTVEGHQGKLVVGKIGGVCVAVFGGRFHAYEGLSLERVVTPVRLFKMIGGEKVILTNAAGGINLSYKPGTLVIINDHINFTGNSPLVGHNIDELGPRFPDMGDAYNTEMRATIQSVAKELGIELENGIYAGVLGPTYETPAEVRMLRTMGADVVGMSTVHEVIAANHAGLKVACISCVTNMAAGVNKEVLRHEDIKEQALKVKEKFAKLLISSLSKL